MKKRMLGAVLSLMLVVLVFLSTLAAASDTPSSWAAEAITRADSLGLIPSSLNGNYTQNITRAEFCALAVPVYEKLTGTEITQLRDFTDTTDINVRKIGGENIVSGTGNGAFNPDGEITRQEAAVILSNLMSAMAEPLPESEPTFADNAQIDTWAMDAVGRVQKAGIMSGTGNNYFNPKGDAGRYTREQSIITIVKVWDIVETTRPSADDSKAEDDSAMPAEKQAVGNILIAYFTVPETDGLDAVSGASRVVVDGEVLGNNQYIAQLIQQSVGGDLFRIETVQEYPGSHDALLDFAYDEKANNARPELASKIEELADYDVIFIGYPNWNSELPMPLYTFLEENDFSGKTIVPFNVHGGSGFSRTINTIAELQPNATVITNGFSISRDNMANAQDEVVKWVQTLEWTNE